MVEYGAEGALFACDQIDFRSFGKFVRVGLGHISIKSHCPDDSSVLSKNIQRPNKTDLQTGIIVHNTIRFSLPALMKDSLLHDAMQRDITTARRVALLEILWNERYLTRAQLIARVELWLCQNCFGSPHGKTHFTGTYA